MKKTLSSLTVAVIAAFAAQGAMAQAAPAPSRADVKKEAAAANKAGTIPQGEAAMQAPPVSKKSDAARADVKKDTAAANKAGAIPGTTGGGALDKAGEKQVSDAKSAQPRADVKKDTAAANKAGAIPQGEAAMQAPKK